MNKRLEKKFWRNISENQF